MPCPILRVFTKRDGDIFYFLGTELEGNRVDTVWPCWNLKGFTPEGRADRMTPPQDFRSEFLEKHFLSR